MSTRYLLTCSCGERIAIEARQAGRQIQCRCGTMVNVPTMLALKQLPQIDGDATGTPNLEEDARLQNIGSRFALLLIGLLILTTGTVGFMLIWRKCPPHPLAHITDQRINETIESFSPVQLVNFWDDLKNVGVEGHQAPPEVMKRFDRALMMNRIWRGTMVLLAIVGIAIALGSMIQRSHAAHETADGS